MKKFDELERSVVFNSNTMDEIQKSLNQLLKENNQLKKEQVKLKSDIRNLQDDLVKIKRNQGSDDHRQKNLIVMGIRPDDSETAELSKIFRGLDIEIQENEFKAKRIPSKNPQKPIIVTFLSKEKKELVLNARKKKGVLDSISLGLNGDKRKIFLNEDIAKDIRNIFNKARELRNHGFKFVWCADNRVLCRKDSTTEVIKLNTYEQIEKLKNDNRGHTSGPRQDNEYFST